jgi:AcrR family transcriptional regulator
VSQSPLETVAPQETSEVRKRVITAAEQCFERLGVAKTNVADIATQAGVSRATVYRYFDGGREEIVMGVLMREIKRLEANLRRRLTRTQRIEELPVEAVMFCIESAEENQHLALLFAPEVAGQTSALAAASDALHARVAEIAGPYLEEAQRLGIARQDLDRSEAAELLIRTTVSLLGVPSGRTPAQERRFLRKFLVPAFVSPSGGEESGELVALDTPKPTAGQ